MFMPEPNDNKYKLVFILVYLILAVYFALTQGFGRLTTYVSTQHDFYVDHLLFRGPADILSTYIKKMDLLTFRGKHYPPGNILLFAFFSQIGFIPGFKLLCYICPIICFLCLDRTMSFLGYSSSEKRFSLFLFLFGYGVLGFVSTATTPLVLMMFGLAQLTFFKSRMKNYACSNLLTGLFFSISFLLSFSAVVMMVFFALTDVFYRSGQSLISILKDWTIIILTMGLFFLGLYWFFGFNMYECFRLSVKHNQTLMTINPFDSISRYLLRSSGNLIAFLILPNLAASILGIWSLKAIVTGGTRIIRSYAASFIITICLFAFSGLFFLETERIWLFLTPCLAVLGGWWFKGVPFRNKANLERCVVIIVIMTAFTIELSLRCYI